MLIQKLKYAQNLTTQERHIIEYILDHPEIVFKATAHELARMTFTSSSTIVRLCKKLGTKGYPDFQLQWALEYKPNPQKDEPEGELAIEQGNLPAAIEALPYLYEQSLSKTRQMLKEDSLIKIVRWLKSSERIDIYGSDNNYYLAQQASAKWNELGINAVAHNSANFHYLNSINLNMSPLSFVISHTGHNRAMVEVAKALRNKQMRMVAVTSNNNSALTKLCDETILTYGYDERMRLSKLATMVSVLYIFDVLYMSTIPEEG
ncbi:MurR/RpiR family transcriptional regulator [Paenibacillus kribbensis]|uniref:MurR/RpiR family transcriptional regulator n=1 Tax=Paenibacillus kribbensis TaxID=172713 RepID=UPI000837DD5D|nr:MurR/RpiR family transcriptional regulator [Paenibacillus kribbensis]